MNSQTALVDEAAVAMVRHAAARIVRRLPSVVRFEDLNSAGLEALTKAARRYDASRGVDFRTYAKQRVMGAMIDHLRRSDTVSRDRRKAIREGKDDDTKVVPRLVDISAAAATPDEGMLADEQLDRIRDVVDLRAAMRKLPVRLRKVMQWRIVRGDTLITIANRLEVTEGRACQLVGEATRKLRVLIEEGREAKRAIRAPQVVGARKIAAKKGVSETVPAADPAKGDPEMKTDKGTKSKAKGQGGSDDAGEKPADRFARVMGKEVMALAASVLREFALGAKRPCKKCAAPAAPGADVCLLDAFLAGLTFIVSLPIDRKTVAEALIKAGYGQSIAGWDKLQKSVSSKTPKPVKKGAPKKKAAKKPAKKKGHGNPKMAAAFVAMKQGSGTIPRSLAAAVVRRKADVVRAAVDSGFLSVEKEGGQDVIRVTNLKSWVSDTHQDGTLKKK